MYLALLCLTVSLGYTLGNSPKPSPEGCSALAGCLGCVVDSCPVLEEGQTKHPMQTDEVDRCVEYDHIEPSHCASVSRTLYQIRQGMFVVGYCYSIVCCYGTPNSEECAYPYTCP